MPPASASLSTALPRVQPAAPAPLGGDLGVSLRPFPYPYRAMLAICSDLDETPDLHAYLETLRYLNTTETTSMGPGLGLEVGNSIYFDMPPGQVSYWNADEAGREMIRALIRSGHVDCLHSFGDLAATRAHAGRALDELARHGCRLEVWADHAVAPTNVGADIMRGQGDVPGSPAYHADLTVGFGVRYVWRGRITSVVGQDAPPSLRALQDWRHPLASARTVLKEGLKGLLGRAGSAKYAMHGANRLLRPVRLRSGQRVQEFMRANPHWGGVSQGDRPDGLPEVLSGRVLQELVRREAVCVLYTHLGKGARPGEILPPRARAALRGLARLCHEGQVLVTTTRRLLGYCEARRRAVLSASAQGGLLTLAVDSGPAEAPTPAPEDLAGLSIYVPDPCRTRVIVNGRPVSDLRCNPPDHTGQPSVSLPWRRLEFPRP